MQVNDATEEEEEEEEAWFQCDITEGKRVRQPAQPTRARPQITRWTFLFFSAKGMQRFSVPLALFLLFLFVVFSFVF